MNSDVEKFTVGNDFLLDQKLVKYDCIASIAHAKMLEKMKIISGEECKKLVATLDEIIALDASGKFVIEREDEDCHTAIENYLVKKLGETGKKIHTARSRNDQVLTALRLYCKHELGEIAKSAKGFISSLESFKKEHGQVKMPGYTHMRKAMPSSVGMWAGSFIDSMKDNIALLEQSAILMDQSPLGTGAGYDLPIEVDREMTAALLGFKKVQENPIYVQNSRGKFEATMLHALTQVMLDLNKMASDIILFSMPEFGYFVIPDELCTGSSIMPQKKNPDVLELVRAKYHVVVACEFELKSIPANLISGYNRDMQLTKESLFKGIEITKEALEIMKMLVMKLKVDEANCRKSMTNELYAAEKAHELVKKGMAFRDAYKKVASETS
jgi:argininosuccinate lyase